MTRKSITEEHARHFCEECQDAYENWVTLKYGFEDLPQVIYTPETKLSGRPLRGCLSRMYWMCWQSCLSQIARLHDPAQSNNQWNLSINLFQHNGNWTHEENGQTDKLADHLNRFYGYVKPARNKLIAHNDLQSIVADDALGAFPKGADQEYFRNLGDFAQLIWRKWCLPSTNPLDSCRVFRFEFCGPLTGPNSSRDDARHFCGLVEREFQRLVNVCTKE